jgi:hypothetical protein
VAALRGDVAAAVVAIEVASRRRATSTVASQAALLHEDVLALKNIWRRSP